MCGCDCNGCLSVRATTINAPISIIATSLSEQEAKMVVVSYRLDKEAEVAATRLGERVKVRCGIVCSIGKDKYLNTDRQVVWLDPSILSSAEFRIESNVSWTIN